MFDTIDLEEKFRLVTEFYTPKQIASLNGTAIKERLMANRLPESCV